VPSEAFLDEAPLAEVLEENVEHEQHDEVIQVEVQPQPEALEPVKAQGDGPQVMIYHTHSHEAYEKGNLNYKETGQWRTADTRYNIIRVGSELTQILQNQYGLSVLHDTTDHEPPKLGTAYTRSLKTLSAAAKANPSLKVFIDLHRDAYSKGMTRFVEIDGKEVAQIMLVIGTGEGSSGNGFSEKPDWEKNYQLADQITKGLQEIHPDLARAIRVKTGRYNQHISTGCILIEAGHNENTLEQVLNAMPYLAKVLAQVMGK
jgi:stage II sporulation protein P